MLNSNDFYEKDNFENVASIFQEHAQVDVVMGQAVILEQGDSESAYIVEKYPLLREQTLLKQLVYDPLIINAWFF